MIGAYKRAWRCHVALALSWTVSYATMELAKLPIERGAAGSRDSPGRPKAKHLGLEDQNGRWQCTGRPPPPAHRYSIMYV
jgi:hypothetical protein